MKQWNIHIVFFLLILFSFSATAQAFEEVRVFQPKKVMEEGKENQKPRELSPMEMRSKARELGFSEAVMQTALKLLPQAPSEERIIALRSFLDAKAGQWVLGYKEVAATPSAKGLTMVLEVDVNRRALRDTLEALGLHRAAGQPQYVTILPMPTLLEADKEDLDNVMRLVNAQDRPGSGPRISFTRLESGTLRGELTAGSGAWTAMDADIETVWFTLWERYLSMGGSRAGTGGTELIITGWFTPAGVTDFDRVLQQWDGLVRSARLLEMNLGTAGVSARWAVQLVNMSGFQAKLRNYLPARGLEFSMHTGQ